MQPQNEDVQEGCKALRELDPQGFIWFPHLYLKTCLQPVPPGQQSQLLAKLFPRNYKQNGSKSLSMQLYKKTPKTSF